LRFHDIVDSLRETASLHPADEPGQPPPEWASHGPASPQRSASITASIVDWLPRPDGFDADMLVTVNLDRVVVIYRWPVIPYRRQGGSLQLKQRLARWHADITIEFDHMFDSR
jgi:hypothetical protein